MKKITAYIHPHRTAAVIRALRDSGICDTHPGPACCHITVAPVQCVQATQETTQQHYSVELGEAVVLRNRLELICGDDKSAALVDLIIRNGHSGQVGSGWVQVQELESRTSIS